VIFAPVLSSVFQPVTGSVFAPSQGGTDADAAAWAAAVTAAGGTYSAAGLAASSAFVVSAKAAGYWTKLNRINLFAGGGGTAAQNLTGTLVPLKVGGGSATETNVNFVAGDYTEATGLTGNGSTKYLNTGLIANTSLTLNDTHLAVYNRSSTAAAGGLTMGVNSEFSLQAPFSDGNAYSDQYNTVAGRVSGALAAPYGFVVGSRTAAASHTIYRNAVSVATNATSGGTLSLLATFVFACNSGGSPALFISQPLAGYSIGSGLSGADVTAYNTHMQAFQTALGRNV
jgi:hypothetical protein